MLTDSPDVKNIVEGPLPVGCNSFFSFCEMSATVSVVNPESKSKQPGGLPDARSPLMQSRGAVSSELLKLRVRMKFAQTVDLYVIHSCICCFPIASRSQIAAKMA